MRTAKEYHHFKIDLIDGEDRLARCERYIVDFLMDSKLPDSERESSICWELKHQASTAQFARILAIKRGLRADICAIGLLFHDIYSIKTGKYKEHAYLGAPMALEMVKNLGSFSKEELDLIWKIVYHHSDKDIWSENPYEEIGKDADVLDTFLYDGAFNYYLAHKPLKVFKEYLRRIKKIWKELGLTLETKFDLLDRYRPSWFQLLRVLDEEMTKELLCSLSLYGNTIKSKDTCPPFSILVEGEVYRLYGEKVLWDEILERHEKSTKEIRHKGELDKVLFKNKNLPKDKTYMLMFWPLISLYESLIGENMESRLHELGISNQNSKKETS